MSLTILTRSSILRSITGCWIYLGHFFRFTVSVDLFLLLTFLNINWKQTLHTKVCVSYILEALHWVWDLSKFDNRHRRIQNEYVSSASFNVNKCRPPWLERRKTKNIFSGGAVLLGRYSLGRRCPNGHPFKLEMENFKNFHMPWWDSYSYIQSYLVILLPKYFISFFSK